MNRSFRWLPHHSLRDGSLSASRPALPGLPVLLQKAQRSMLVDAFCPEADRHGVSQSLINICLRHRLLMNLRPENDRRGLLRFIDLHGLPHFNGNTALNIE